MRFSLHVLASLASVNWVEMACAQVFVQWTDNIPILYRCWNCAIFVLLWQDSTWLRMGFLGFQAIVSLLSLYEAESGAVGLIFLSHIVDTAWNIVHVFRRNFLFRRKMALADTFIKFIPRVFEPWKPLINHMLPSVIMLALPLFVLINFLLRDARLDKVGSISPQPLEVFVYLREYLRL